MRRATHRHTDTHTAKWAIALLIFMTVLPSTYGELSAQNFPWVTGATGRSWGEGTTVEIDGDVLVVGSFEPAANVQFSSTTSTPIQPVPFSNPNAMSAYIARYDQNGNSQSSAVILPIAGQLCATNTNESWVVLKQVVVTPGNEIYVIGEFNACALEFYDTNGVSLGQAASAINADLDRVFVAHYDQTLTYQGCYFFTAQGQCTSFYDGRMHRTSTAADVAVGVEDVNNAIFIGANFCGESVRVEHFGNMNPPAAGLANMPINVGLNKQWQIYLGELNYSTNTLQSAIEMGLEQDDLVSELTTGYLYGGSHLFMSGTFTDFITFVSNGGASSSTYAGFGDFDVFACRFNNMDLLEQDGVVAGSPNRDQALAISDDGMMVGGFVTDSAFFNGIGTLVNLNPTVALPGGGPIRQEGFIAIPDYDNNNWEWVTQIVNDVPQNNCFDSQVNELAGSCEEVYVAWNRGMHDEVLDLPEYHLLSAQMPIPGNPGSSLQSAYTRLEKWHHLGTAATQIWEYDLINGSPVAMDCGVGPFNHSNLNRKVKMVRDIEVRSETYFDGSEDVMMTGWFGTELRIPNNPPWVTNPIYDGGGPGVHDENGMFLLSMDEEPRIQIDSTELCWSSPIDTIEAVFLPTAASGANWNLPNLNAIFSGTGIIDPINGVFSPSIAGPGIHVISLSYEYFGCQRQDTVAVYFVDPGEYPKQPQTVGVEWSEGLAAAGVPPDQLGVSLPDTTIAWDINFLAGRYFDEISFERTDGTIITLNSPGTESGYIVAYDACGAIWAINVSGTGDDYIEHLLVAATFISGDESVATLYAAGGFEGPLTLDHYNSPTTGLATPTVAVNNSITLSSIPTGIKKGIVMEIEPLTGEVNWVYVGSDNLNHQNSFHGLTHADGFLVAAGNRSTAFSYNNNTTTVFSLAGGDDPFFIVMDDNGTVLTTSIGSNGFGTPGNDHGDAVSMMRKSDKLFIAFGGDLNTGVVNNTFQDTFGNLASVDEDVFVAKYNYTISTNSLVHERIKVYGGAGEGHLHDVLMVAPDDFSPFSSNTIFFCGSFENEFDLFLAGGQTMNTGSGLGDYDIYIGCVDPSLADQWFTHEGSDFGPSEAARSLELKGTSLYVYGERQFALGTVTSDFYDNSGASIGSGVFSSFPPTNLILGGADIFTVGFSSAGTYLDGIQTEGIGVGISNGHDLTLVDTSFVNAGSLRMTLGDQLEFLDQFGIIQNILLQNSNTSNAYLARTLGFQLGSFKRDNEDNEDNQDNTEKGYSLYPNPTEELLTIQFDEPRSGSILLKDKLGRTLSETTLPKVKFTSMLIEGSPGMYFLEIRAGNHVFVEKVIKK